MEREEQLNKRYQMASGNNQSHSGVSLESGTVVGGGGGASSSSISLPMDAESGGVSGQGNTDGDVPMVDMNDETSLRRRRDEDCINELREERRRLKAYLQGDEWKREKAELKAEKAELKAEKARLEAQFGAEVHTLPAYLTVLKQLSSKEDQQNRLSREIQDINKEIQDINERGRPPQEQTSTSGSIQRLEAAKHFVKFIMNEPVEIPGSDGMSSWKIPMLETGHNDTVVLRKITKPFWEACIKMTQNNIRVCAVGTPGVGKTTTTPLLIKMLLEMKHTVVYCIREPKGGWCYEFEPDKDRNVTLTRVYPEGQLSHIPSLRNPTTYYVVDPGKTIDSCDLGLLHLCKVIIIASPDSRHWGGNEFVKYRGTTKARFLYFPLWELKELQDSRAFLGQTLSAQEIMDRYLKVGGVPRNIIKIDAALQAQEAAIRKLTEAQVRSIASKEVGELDSKDSSQPSSAIMGYRNKNVDNPFETSETVLISGFVAEKIAMKHKELLWNFIFPAGHGWDIFEGYTRQLMADGKAHEFDGRTCVGKMEPEYELRKKITLGGCNGIQCSVDDIVSAAFGKPNVVFHSANTRNELIDFIYCKRDSEGDHFYAFQATIGKTHTASVDKIKELRKKILDKTQKSDLSLCYLVSDDQYTSFVTQPVSPIEESNTNISIWHVAVPNPNKSDVT